MLPIISAMYKSVLGRTLLTAAGVAAYSILKAHGGGSSWDSAFTDGGQLFLVSAFGRGVLEAGYDVVRAGTGSISEADVPVVTRKI